MYLTKSERKIAMSAYGYEDLVEDNHYQVDYDYEFKKTEFVLQRELPIKDENLLMNIHANTILFEYTD